MEKYWEKEYNDILDGIVFKFEKLKPVQVISMISKDGKSENDSKKEEELITMVLQGILFKKSGGAYRPIINESGISNMEEYDENPSIILDLYMRYKEKVLAPVFLESRTFQNMLKEVKETSQSNK